MALAHSGNFADGTAESRDLAAGPILGERLESSDPELLDAYKQADTVRRASRLRIGIWISAVGMLAGVTLDYFVYPEHILRLFLIRILAVAALFILLFLLNAERRSRTLVKGLGISMALIDNLAFTAMVFFVGGAFSSYYAGINLVLLGMSVLLPWTFRETLWVCVVSIAIYSFACLIEGGLFQTGGFSAFFNNVFFIAITGVICVVSAEFQARARFQDFELRHRLDMHNQKLQELDKLKTNFFSNITHELRTPLALILGPIDTVLKRCDNLDERVHENLIVAQRNSLRLLKLINDLLDLTRMEQGDNVISKKRFKLHSYVEEIVDSVRHLATGKGVALRVDASAEPVYLEADPARLEKVILNLLTNAIKFTRRGDSIRVGWDSLPGAQTRIFVEDSGVGIKQEDQARIFDRFYQVSGEGGSREQGVGIGLALAKELVAQHGGELEVSSEVGKGSRFTILLPGVNALDSGLSDGGSEVPEPRPAEDSQAVDEVKDRAEASAAGSQPFLEAFRSADRTLVNRNSESDEITVSGTGKHTVLVIEDEPDMMRYIGGLLSEHYKTVRARDGRNLAYLVETYQPQLILLDWMLPGRDGLTLCREIRSQRDHDTRKIVMLTARVDEESKVLALEAGADDFLLKPFSSIELITRIDNLLRSSELQAELKQSNQELRNTLEKLQQTEAHLIQSEKINALGSLSAGLLHEINNPLNYVFSGVQLLEMDSSAFDANTREVLADIKEGLVRVNDVMRDLKTFAYPEKPGQVSDFLLHEVFESARKLTSKETMGVDLKIELSDDLMVEGQKTQWMHVFVNLLTNAGKALEACCSEREKTIEVSAKRQDGRITLVFRDNGVGMPDEVRQRVFEPFFTTRDVGQGMGMGLSVCRTIVENHGGTISVESEPDQHTTFTLTIPVS
ncbi:MAG: response regulator [Puniceicoccaceae bacterium]|nr:MAG: response regulator [Puniceicoccaceae bacterium]